ncbi:MAG: ABC transporter ATP-binding protein [Thermotogae bacterium]|nr:ABC transporter ATP-binding protein [Thermotogota bacterium]
MLEVKGIDVYYGKLHVIWNLSIMVGKEEGVGIFGPNGAGKTTLINTIIGLVKPKNGEILFEGRRIDNLEPHQIVRLGIAVVPQERELFPFMSVRENLELGADFIPHTKGRLNDLFNFVYETFPILKERESQLAGTMSGGEQRMLAIGRALMADPRLLILDEPSVGLQPSIVMELFHKLKAIRKNGVSILLTEQNVRQGLKTVDRGYILENGRIVLKGCSKELSSNEYVKKSYLGL